MKRACKYVAITFLIAYVAAASLRVEWLWFDPGEVEFSDATFGETPRLTYSREIKLKTMIAYSTVTRDAVNDNILCEGKNGPFEYKPSTGPVVEKDLVWWSAGDPRCGWLPVGSYYTHTTWTLPTPLRALLPEWARDTFLDRLLPPKTVTRDSKAFIVMAR